MDNKFIGYMAVFFATFFLFVVLVGAKVNPFSIRASSSNPPSNDNSLILAWPVILPVDNSTKSTITVFARDADTKAVGNKAVSFSATGGTLSRAQAVTDDDGKAQATFTCSAPGTVEINGIIENSISKTIKIKCQ